jgi:hypothetical protein
VKSNLVWNSVQQWRRTFATLSNWNTNRIETAVIAGATALKSNSRQSREINFFTRFLAVPLTRAVIQPGLNAGGEVRTNFFSAHLVPGLEGLSGVVLGDSSSTCDLDFDGVMPPTVASEPPAQVVAQTAADPVPSGSYSWLAGIVVALLGLAVFAWVLMRFKVRAASSPALIAEYVQDGQRSGSFTVTVAPRSMSGSAQPAAGASSLVSADALKATRTQSEVMPARLGNPLSSQAQHTHISASLVSTLSQWLKQKLVRRLLADRAKLIATQQASSLKVMRVDERLARIEAQIREQNRAYERRIEKLTEQLMLAKEENRELIRAQITKVKAEMEAARAKLVSETKDPAA